jgi:hypothetical protein
MEQQNQTQESGLFGLTIDPAGRGHLAEAAKWARFLAIVGFVGVTLLALIAIFGGSYLATIFGRTSQYNDLTPGVTTGLTFALIAYYLCIALLVFFAYLFLYRFAVNMRAALRENNQDLLNRSFQNLKILYRYWGILTLIGLALFAIFFLFAIIGRATM